MNIFALNKTIFKRKKNDFIQNLENYFIAYKYFG